MMRAVSRSEPLAQRVYALLADRGFHSGAVLAQRCGVSRSAVWKAVATLRALGVTVHAVANRGYRLPQAAEPLSAAAIRAALPPEPAAHVKMLSVVWRTGSTNADLMQRSPLPPGQCAVALAEYQAAGRGRRTRRWFAPPGGAICLSLSWSFASLPHDVGALSLAIGVCSLRALQSVGVRGVTLKWPNDLVIASGKLGGILIELRAETGGPAQVVIGIGLNVALGDTLQRTVEASGTRPTDLAALGVERCDRNALVAALIGEYVHGLKRFERDGFSSFAKEWRDADALSGKPVTVSGEAGGVQGHARGIDADGALCVQTRSGLQRFVSGDVSVRVST